MGSATFSWSAGSLEPGPLVCFDDSLSAGEAACLPSSSTVSTQAHMATTIRSRPSAQSSQIASGTAPTTGNAMEQQQQHRGKVVTTSSQTPLIKPIITILLLTTTLGSLYSSWSTSNETLVFRSRLPSSTITRLSSQLDSFPTHILPYFADKRNLFNQYFVKQAWLWVTGAFVLYSIVVLIIEPATSSKPNGAQPISLSPTSTTPFQSFLRNTRRYLLATLYWYYLTQKTWFGAFYSGPSITRSILLNSGAVCVPSSVNNLSGANPAGDVCTGQKGEYFKGGHDTSGHTFMMVHSILFLYHLIAPSLPKIFGTLSTRRVRVGIAEKTTVFAVIGLIVLWWWMLLMTSLYFHSPAEKLSGFVFGIGGWLVSSL